MSSLSRDSCRRSRVEAHRPWPRVIVSPETWNLASRGAGRRPTWYCLASGVRPTPFTWRFSTRSRWTSESSLLKANGRFPSVGAFTRLRSASNERSMISMDWSRWACRTSDPGSTMAAGAYRHPLGTRAETPPPSAPYPFLTAEGESLHQIPVGPVHAGIIEPGHFRFTANGETVVRLEERLGYVQRVRNC